MTEIDSRDETPIKRALWISLAILALIAVVGAAYYLLSHTSDEPVPVAETTSSGPVQPVAAAVSAPTIAFTDVSTSAGVNFVHETGAYGERMLPETMGGGVALFDYNNDGHLDLLLVNASAWPWQPSVDDARSHLYSGNGDGTFTDAGDVSGLDASLYGMGVAVGDYDGDGFVDVFVSAVGQNRLLHNDAGKSFTDVTASTGVAGADNAWSSSAAFFDYDGDGDLDLFVCNYVDWSKEINESVDYRLTGIGRAYGPPTDFGGTQSYLYRNDGGEFTDVSQDAGIHVINEATGVAIGKGLAVHPIDVNADGLLDIAVANDTVRNFLFVNQGNGAFKESGIEFGLAFDSGGMATGAMGIDAANFANDEQQAIVIGNFANEMSSFYVSQGDGKVFSDDAIVVGIGASSRKALTFGVVFLDLDLDGYLDVIAANGHVEPQINKVQSSQAYAQPVQVFWNCGGACIRQYQLVDETGDMAQPLVGRGAVYGDIDADGDLDVVLTEVGGRTRVLRNDQQSGHHWLAVELQQPAANRNAIGAKLVLETDATIQYRTVMPARSYLSQVPLRQTFGLGASERIKRLTVIWPDGQEQSWTDLAVDQVHVLARGL
jgi:enediyne biosynthesis protein E4